MKQIFDPNMKGTPLFNLKDDIEEKIEKLRKDLGIGEAVKKLEDVTPIKGCKFEETCEQLLCDIVKKHLGDELENTSTIDGRISGSKKGDFVTTLGERPDCKIVLEMKDRGNVSLPEIHTTMQKSIQRF